VAARSKAYVYGRSPAGIVGSNPTGAWIIVCCECCVLAGRGLCDELINRLDESYRLWSVVVCDLENLMNEEPYPINVIELNIEDTSLGVFPTCH